MKFIGYGVSDVDMDDLLQLHDSLEEATVDVGKLDQKYPEISPHKVVGVFIADTNNDGGILKEFTKLKEEMARHYFWCKVKLNVYGMVLLGLLLILR